MRDKQPRSTEEDEDSKTRHVSIPYVAELSKRIGRLLSPLDIIIAIMSRPH